MTDFLDRPILSAWVYKKCVRNDPHIFPKATAMGVQRIHISLEAFELAYQTILGSGLDVEITLGTPEWALSDDANLDRFKEGVERARVDGVRVHLDIEPWADPAWKKMSNEEKAACLMRMASLLAYAREKTKKDVSLAVVNQLSKIKLHGGLSGDEYLADKADSIVLMDYRSDSNAVIISAAQWALHKNHDITVGVNIPKGKTKENAKAHAQKLIQQRFITGIALHPLGDFV